MKARILSIKVTDAGDTSIYTIDQNKEGEKLIDFVQIIRNYFREKEKGVL